MPPDVGVQSHFPILLRLLSPQSREKTLTKGEVVTVRTAWVCPTWGAAPPRTPRLACLARQPVGRPTLGRGLWPFSGGCPRDRRSAGGPFEDCKGQCPHQRYPGIEPEGNRITVVMIIPPSQPHWGTQRPGEGGKLDIASQPTKRLAPEILTDHRPIGRGTGIAQREQHHIGQQEAAPVPG